ncbi:MAG: NYN domain-containing protein [Gammaproteobacteria bacterium]|jgi:uncharacterized LabA/DUF88 family protein|nr:NYN domain-containing protein [Gammaproteobacteria bacterium]
MQRSFAVLIDAGFLKRKLGSQENPMSTQNVVDFIEKIKARPEISDLTLHRVYYYDAEPLAVTKPKPLTGGKQHWQRVNFSSTPLYSANMQLLQELKRKPFFAVRLGEVNFRGWLVKPQILDPKKAITQVQITDADLIPNIQQKGVDMKIGLDISSLSLKNHVDVIVMVTGDSDFIPAMKFARREGKQIYLFTLGHSVRPEVYAHTDLCIEDKIEIL